jgi:hypothetical protein
MGVPRQERQSLRYRVQILLPYRVSAERPRRLLEIAGALRRFDPLISIRLGSFVQQNDDKKTVMRGPTPAQEGTEA